MKYFKIASLCLLVSACKSEKEKQLVGKWEAAKLIECEANVPFQNELVNIEFKPNGKYIFNSTLNVHEEGDFHLEENYLLMQDKIKAGSTEKVVLIKSITVDTMVLEMNYKGKEQFLTLKKANQEPIMAQNLALKDTAKTQNTEGGVPTAMPVSMPTPSNAIDNTEIKKVVEVKPSVEIKKEDVISEAEAYRRRAAKEREERADKERDERDKHAAYLEREAARQKEELARKRKALELEKDRDREQREAYLKREAQRKKEAAARKRG
jgi:hypothetical protein